MWAVTSSSCCRDVRGNSVDNIQLYTHKLKDLHVCLNSIKDWVVNTSHQQVLNCAADSLVPKTKENIASLCHLESRTSGCYF